MKKEIFNVLKKELPYIGILFLFSIAIFKIVFFKDTIVILLRSVLALFWLFVLPGYCIMLYWNEKLEFIERFIIGIIFSAGATGIFSYYIGLIGLNIKYHTVLLPLVIMVIGMIIVLNKKNSS